MLSKFIYSYRFFFVCSVCVFYSTIRCKNAKIWLATQNCCVFFFFIIFVIDTAIEFVKRYQEIVYYSNNFIRRLSRLYFFYILDVLFQNNTNANRMDFGLFTRFGYQHCKPNKRLNFVFLF